MLNQTVLHILENEEWKVSRSGHPMTKLSSQLHSDCNEIPHTGQHLHCPWQESGWCRNSRSKRKRKSSWSKRVCVVLLLFLKLETLKIYRLKRKSKKKKRERETVGKLQAREMYLMEQEPWSWSQELTWQDESRMEQSPVLHWGGRKGH